MDYSFFSLFTSTGANINSGEILKLAEDSFVTDEKKLLFVAHFNKFLSKIVQKHKGLIDFLYYNHNAGSQWIRNSDKKVFDFASDFFDNVEQHTVINIISENELLVELRRNKILPFGSGIFHFCLIGIHYFVLFKRFNLNISRIIQGINDLLIKIHLIEQSHLRLKQLQDRVGKLEHDLIKKERELVLTERSLKRRVYDIHNLLEVSNDLYSILNLKQLINSALLTIVGQIRCHKAYAILYDMNQRRYSRIFTKGLDPIEMANLELEVDHVLVNHFAKNPRPLRVEKIKEHEKLKEYCEFLEKLQIEVIAPIFHSERVQGFIGSGALLNGEKFGKSELEIFAILVNMISISVSNAQTYEEVKNLSLTDAMTNLNNYRYFEDRLKEEINRARRNSTNVSLLMLDIDYFKNYNDTLGHQAGDEALRAIGRILKGSVREEDIVNRYGGEEFCIILPNIDKKVIPVLGERIRRKIEEYPFYKEYVQPGGRITVSLGGASFDDDAESFEELVYKADQALYKSKNSGRNKLILYNQEM